MADTGTGRRRPPSPALIVPLAVLAMGLGQLSGCVSVMERYPGTPPAWFVQAQTELRGEAYPSLVDIPAQRPARRTGEEQAAIAADLRADRQEIAADPAEDAPLRTPDEIRAMAAQLRAAADGAATAPR